jgi:GNAT superfamily N-acetyltransferase
MTADGVTIRPSGTGPDHLAAYSALLGGVFGPLAKFSPQALAWRYRDNPAGAVVGFDAWSGDALAAHYVACPMFAVIEGRPVRGLLSLNTATAPDFQGKGLFARLAEATYAKAADAGFQFVVGFANANSTPGFLRKLAFQKVRALQAGLMPRAPRRLAEQPPQFNVDWSPERLAWRLANPAARYRVAHRDEVTGVWADTHLPMLRCAAILPRRPDLASDAAAPLAPSLFIGLEPRLSLAAHGFLPLPERFRPSPLNMIYRRLDPALPAALDPEAVAISFLDFDPY